MAPAVYVYCVVRSGKQPSRARIPAGLPGASTPQVTAIGDRMWLVHAEVPLDQYGSGPLEASLGDLEWVSARAVAHEAVVEHFSKRRGATVIPMKLFTMFAGAERAVDEMQQRREDLEAVFDRVEGCEEWGVRVTRGARPVARPGAKPATGAAFLAERKRARDESRDAVRAAAEAADEAFASLGGIARDRTRRTRESPGAVPPLLDAAFLVPAGRRARFHAAAKRLARQVAERGGQMTLTGPWPPYNFINRAGGEEGA